MGITRGCLLGLVSVVTLACGQEPAQDELVAVPYPEEDVAGAAEGGDAADAPPRHPVAREAGEAGPGANGAAETGEDGRARAARDGPSPSLTRAFLTRRLEGSAVLEHDHLLADLTGDGVAEVLLALLTGEGEAEVEVDRWTGDGYEMAGRLAAGRADALGQLRLLALGKAERPLVVMALRRGGRPSIAVWEGTAGTGVLATPTRCPVPSGARLHTATGDERTVVCSPGEAGDGDALVWHRGAYRPPDLVEEGADELDDARGGGTAVVTGQG